MQLVHMLMLSVLLALPAVQAAAFEVFQDPNQDGVTGAAPVNIPISGSASLYVYYDNGENGAPPPGTVCLDGAGVDVCGWDIHIASTSVDVTLDNFVPVGDVVWAITESPNVLRANGGDYENGLTGPQPIGQLFVSDLGGAGGDVIVAGNLYVSSSLTAEPVSVGAILATSGCADGDGDTICDSVDACPTYINALPVVDSNGDGIPNDCQCGDTDDDGFITPTDAFTLITCAGAGGPQCAAQDVTLWDTDNDGFITPTDAFSDLNRGNLGTEYENTCGRRPSGLPAP